MEIWVEVHIYTKKEHQKNVIWIPAQFILALLQIYDLQLQKNNYYSIGATNLGIHEGNRVNGYLVPVLQLKWQATSANHSINFKKLFIPVVIYSIPLVSVETGYYRQ